MPALLDAGTLTIGGLAAMPTDLSPQPAAGRRYVPPEARRYLAATLPPNLDRRRPARRRLLRDRQHGQRDEHAIELPFPYIWDEIYVPFRYDTDPEFAREMLQRVVGDVTREHTRKERDLHPRSAGDRGRRWEAFARFFHFPNRSAIVYRRDHRPQARPEELARLKPFPAARSARCESRPTPRE